MSKNYNKKRYFELLKKRSMGMDSEEFSSELWKYSCILENHLDWESRDNYLELLEDFRNGKLEDLKFCVDFEKRGLLITYMVGILESNLILLSSNEKSLGFSDLIAEISDICSEHLERAQFYTKESRIEFKNRIEKIYFQIQKSNIYNHINVFGEGVYGRFKTL